ncbi:AAA family ATPase [Robiginitalea sp. SC105]|uniref:AAA family ATPase n=1 Tax=Robiginitalea sp. SC105 TaxID=2762332 RepID=UPI00163A939F|nr:AAA family ATPase [Robiginitalea sp. SC105]MBC2840118.1 AAA family ATPase [Robiginitalea sp. SC105]
MITKIKHLRNLAVFRSFDWDSEVRDKGNNVVLFKKVNIIYGRNYSGKTTLSRVIRALEIGKISDKFDDPECCICIEGSRDVQESDFEDHNKVIRVFNEDFIEDNLKFIVNPDENIEPFAILGGDNTTIEKKISDFKEKLGSNEDGKETGIYKELKSLDTIYQAAKKSFEGAQSSLKSQLSSKATSRPNGIKYQSDKFGDQNYNITKLNSDIEVVKKVGFSPITDNEKMQFEGVLKEQSKDTISELSELTLSFPNFKNKTKEIVTREISQSDKIQSLVKNAVLNRWVKEGKDLHQDKLETCSFCDNKISENRWKELDKHFDEESDYLENDINQLLNELEAEKELISLASLISKNAFYSRFHDEIDSLSEKYKSILKNYEESLISLETQLQQRRKDILNVQSFNSVNDYSSELEKIRSKYDEVRILSNDFSKNLKEEKEKAMDSLRLQEIYDFIQDIKYDEQISNISDLHAKVNSAEQFKNEKAKEIDELLDQVSALQRELKDESKGAELVNKYLNDYFGHSFLSLKAIEFDEEDTGNKKYRFEIHRENKKAFHLSEGEKSLIAICYFMAKLQDVDTKTKNPIIWIDDPISSLDSNHIFFIYTLINTQIFKDQDFEQLFVSTHNLNFLKYLKRLPGALNKSQSKYLIIERNDSTSTISEMPKYIKDYVTEFNYLFNQILVCSKMESVNDENYTAFYNFGNNARKFLEIYLYYKYPDSSDDIEKMRKFFGDKDIPTVLINRINNEYSHLTGIFERGASVVEVPEMNRAAKLIIEKVSEDEDQYSALLRSVGIQD